MRDTPWWRQLGEPNFGLDLRSLAVLRIGLGLLLLLDLLGRSRSLVAHYTDSGVLPRDVLLDQFAREWHFSLHLIAGNGWQVGALFVLHAAAALLLLVGYRTRVAGFVCWLLLISLQSRNPVLLNAGDTLFRLLMFWSLFLPLGARWSIDRLRDRGPAPAGPLFLSVATLALTLQICMVYWFTAVLKSSPKWWNGDALFYMLHADLFVTRSGLWLRELAWPLKPLTLASLGWEILGPVLLFVPFWRGPVRTFVVAGFVVLHLGMWMCLEIGIFPFVCIVAWLVLLPSWFWDRLGCIPTAAWGPVQPLRARWSGGVLAGVFLVYVLGWNLRVLPSEIKVVGRIFRIEQQWNMFAPGPTTNDGWFVIEGVQLNGDVVDLLAGGGPVSWDKPELVIDTIPGRRWGKYLGRLRQSKYRDHRKHLARYYGRTWNAEHEGDQRIERVRINYMREDTRADGPQEPRKILLWRLTRLVKTDKV